MRVLILTNGDYGDYSFCNPQAHYDYVICADNGMKHAKKLNMVPDYIMGDFDSTDPMVLEFYKAKGIPYDQYPSEKDETDTEIAIDRALELGATSIDIYGGLGSRFDHTLANVHLLYKALKKGVKARLMNSHNKVFLIQDFCKLYGQEGDLVSLLPLTERVTGIDTKGLAYPLSNASFYIGKPYGISNYLCAKEAYVKIETGILIVIQAID